MYICLWLEYYYSISCEYPAENMSINVENSRHYLDYLVVQFLYQGGQTDIAAVEVAQVSNRGSRHSTLLMIWPNHHINK